MCAIAEISTVNCFLQDQPTQWMVAKNLVKTSKHQDKKSLM